MGRRGRQSKDNTVWSGQRWGRSAGWGCPWEGHPAERRRNPEALPGEKLLGALQDYLTGQGRGRGQSPMGGLQAQETEEAGEARRRRELARPCSEPTLRHLDFV